MPPHTDTLRADRLRLVDLLRSSGSVALSLHGRVSASYKGDGSPVTEADLAMQDVLVRGLEDAFPDDGIRSEEGERRPRARMDATTGTWHVDPIDGTGAFLHGLAHWGPTVCRFDAEGRVDLAAYYEPMLDRCFSAARGDGAWCDDRRLPAAVDRDPRHDDVLFVPSRIHTRPGLPWHGKLRCLGSTAAHLCLLAAGGGRAALVGQWSTWDVGCGLLLNEEIGHVARTAHGEDLDLAVCSEGLPFVVGAPKAVSRILDTDGWASRAMLGRRT